MERLGNSAWSVARGPVIVSREKPGGSDFPSAPNIQQANSVCVSSESNDGATAFESERTPMVVLSMAAKKHVVLVPKSLGRRHWLQPSGSFEENDLTHSNAANATGFTFSPGSCDRTVDFNQPLEESITPQSATVVDEAPNPGQEGSKTGPD